MSIPSLLPEWDKNELNIVEADTDHKNEGWLAPAGVPEKPPFQTFNWWQNLVYRWIKYFKEFTLSRVNDYTELSALTGMIDGQTVNVVGAGISGLFTYDSAKSGTNDKGTIIDGWVRQYVGVINSKWFIAFSDALALGKTIDIDDEVISITSSLTAPAFGISLISNKGGSITGYDGLGITVGSGIISLKNIKVSGFYDGTNDNELNIATAFIRIPIGSTIDLIELHNTTMDTCRSGIVASFSDANDFTPAPTTIIKNIEVLTSSFSNTPLPLTFRCKVNRGIFSGNEFRDIVGAGRDVIGIACFLDAQAFGTLDSDDIANLQFIGNKFKTIINKTTTGDSTAGNNYETHAIFASGYNVVVDGNIVEDCTGNIYDCEGLYTKARFVAMTNNIMINAGGNQGALIFKGTVSDASATPSAPYGDRCIMSNNIVEYNTYSYDNFGTIVDLELLGLYCEATYNVLISNNLVRGVNTECVLLNGVEGSVNRGITVENNTFEDFRGTRVINARGAFNDLVVSGNKAQDILSDNANVTFFFLDGAVLNRGIINKGITVVDNKYRVGDKTTNDAGSTFDFFSASNIGYPIEDVVVNDNTIEVQSATAATRVVYFTGATEAIDNVTFKYNTLVGIYNASIFTFGANTPQTFECDVDFICKATNATVFPIVINPQDASVASQDTKGIAHSAVTIGSQISRSQRATHTAAGTTISDGAIADAVIGNLNAATVVLSGISESSGVRAQATANVADGEVTFNINYKLKIA